MPDPLLETTQYLRQHMPVPVLGLVSQPHLEDWGCLSTSSSIRNDVTESITAGISYTLAEPRRPRRPGESG